MVVDCVKVLKGDLDGEFSMNPSSGCKTEFSTVLYLLLCIDLYFFIFHFYNGLSTKLSTSRYSLFLKKV